MITFLLNVYWLHPYNFFYISKFALVKKFITLFIHMYFVFSLKINPLNMVYRGLRLLNLKRLRCLSSKYGADPLEEAR